MTEAVYDDWKNRFRCVEDMHANVPTAKRIIYATAILHNLAVLWNDEMPDDEEVYDDSEDDDSEDDDSEDDDNGPRDVEARDLGRILRDQMCANMPPASSEEEEVPRT
jgi:hypothetical protein